MERRTPLYEEHCALEGKMVPFAGYLLPIEYPLGLMKEHLAVRTTCGMFDVSHMGEVVFSGSGALATLNHLMTNRFNDMAIGRCRYAALCYEDGGMVDDLIIYRLAEDEFLAVVNAANKDKDVAWMGEHLLADTEMRDISDDVAQIAVQGPHAQKILTQLVDESTLPQKYYTFSSHVEIVGADCLVSRTGYTGEDGVEIYCSCADAPVIWKALLEVGADDGLTPCGLGARDTLRLEASMPLYGHEMNETIDPLEAGLSFGVKMDKTDFIGKEAIAAKGEPSRIRIGLEVTGRGIVREHEPVFFGDRLIGTTTSGTYCPFLKKACAMALVEAGSVALADEVTVEVRGRKIAACVVPIPFYKRN